MKFVISTDKKALSLALILVAAATTAVNCSERRERPPADDTGRIQFSLKLSSLAQIDSVTYTVSGNGLTPISGMIDVSGTGVASAVVTGLPAAKGYVVEAKATSTDKKTVCSGQADFEIRDGQQAEASLILACYGPSSSGTGAVRIDGTFDNCPVVTAIAAVPAGVAIGENIALIGTYSDLDGDPVSFSWGQAPLLGRFGSVTAAKTTFTCVSPGLTTLTLSVSDGTCGRDATMTVHCGFFTSDAGADAMADAATGTGGAGTGGMGSGGTGTGGMGTGGTGTGGMGTGGMGTGGTSGGVGGVGVGGTTGTGGQGTGGSGVGGAGTGGAGTGGAGTGGSMGTGGAVACMPTHCAGLACDECTFGVPSGQPDLCATLANGCTNCQPDTDDCDGLADPGDRALCQNLYACFVAPTHPSTSVPGACTPLDCWCGTSPATCATSNADPTKANGPCLNQILAAAKIGTYNAPFIFQHLTDPTLPLGRAVNLANCRESFCVAECHLPF